MTGESDNNGFWDSVVSSLDSMDSWFESISNTIGKGFTYIGHSFSDAFLSIWNMFMQTYVGRILGFIWDIIMFLLYGVRSIILLIWNLIYSMLNGFVQMFTQLFSTFIDLSVFMGSTTSILISMFSLILMIVTFSFLFRFFTGKYHYKGFKK